MDKGWMPTVAGILDIVAGVAGVMGGALLAFGGAVLCSVAVGSGTSQAEDFPLYLLVTLLAGLTLGVFVVGILAIVGGVFAIQGRRWGWALMGAIAALFCLPPVGIPAIILTVLGEKEFSRRGRREEHQTEEADE